MGLGRASFLASYANVRKASETVDVCRSQVAFGFCC